MNEPSREQTLVPILQAYLEAVDAGQKPDREELLRQHPDLADELREFFADQEKMERFAKSMHKAHVVEATIGLDGPSGTENVPARIRYVGDYELLEEIARGGMGVVYKARQVTLKRIVAVKMILAGELANPTDVERFHTEARAAANLHHANIVAIHEVGQHQGQHYYSMDYVAGESLGHRIVRGPLPAREAAALMKKVAEAVSFAHVECVIHRDLKPANILLDASGEPHVTDFGLAKRVASGQSSVAGEEKAAASSQAVGHSSLAADLTASGQVLGTPSYMPPEQAAGKTKEIGPRSDVYSLGAVLYCALTGRPPFQAASPVDTLLQVLDRDPVPPRTLNSAVPRDLETICLKCLEKDARRRYRPGRPGTR